MWNTTRRRLAMAMAMAMTMAATATAGPEVCEPPTALVVLDRSSSMTGAIAGATSKWAAARSAIDHVLAVYDQSIAFGLMLFPHPSACGPGRLEVPPSTGQRGAIGMALVTPPPPLGNWTPLGETLLAAADPDQIGGYQPDYVVAITDGFQWCSPYDPAQRDLPRQAVKLLRDRGVLTFVVGFGAGVDEEALSVMARLGGTAPADCDPTATDPARPRCYHQADDAASLTAALMAIAAHTSAETCDGRDNDCDGVVDDGASCGDGQTCADGACVLPPPPIDAGVDAAIDASALGADAGDPPGHPAGCGCGASPGTSGAIAAALLVAALQRRRRRGNASASPATSASPAGVEPLL